MDIVQIVYHSRWRAGSADRLGTLREILAVSRRNNERDALTGFLIFDGSVFLQVIEGERRLLGTTYNRIQTDPRHGGVTLLAMRERRGRSFANWTMGGSLRSAEQQEIFLRHGVAGPIEPTRLTAPAVISLAMELQGYEIGRKRSLHVAG